MNESVGEQFNKDPRIQEAKELLREVLQDYQKRITGVRPPQDHLKESYQKLLDYMGQLRGRPLFFPYIGSGIGHASLVELADGSVKYDFITGIGVHAMGHSHLKIMDACVDAALEDTVMQGNLQQDKALCELADMLIKAACANGAGLKHCFITTSGAMANENAFKVIFQKKHPANRLLAFKRCFTGRSLATAQMTDKPQYREGLPQTITVDYIPFFDASRPKESLEETLQELSVLLSKHPGEYAGMSFELIQGEGGYYPGSREFFTAVMDVLKANSVAIKVDEIQTFGRTTSAFAFQYFGLDKYVDVVTIGKMSQVCATFYTEEFNPRPGLLSQTFSAGTASIHAAKVILHELLTAGYLGEGGRIDQLSKHFMHGLSDLSCKYPDDIHGPFGLGAMIGFSYKDGSPAETKKFIMDLFEAGVMGFIAGANPTRIRFLMPIFAVTEKDIDAVLTIIEKTIKG